MVISIGDCSQKKKERNGFGGEGQVREGKGRMEVKRKETGNQYLTKETDAMNPNRILRFESHNELETETTTNIGV